jgi:hypothetical protein
MNSEDRISNSEWVRPNRRSTIANRQWVGARVTWSLALLLGTGASGCITPCPFHDPFANEPPITTASVEGVRQSGATAHLLEPMGEPKFVSAMDGTVTHRPLYFEDGREVTGSNDGQIAWTGEDYAYIVTGPLRYLVNFFTVPAEMVVYPPWHVMASDGVADREILWWRVDSRRWQEDGHDEAHAAGGESGSPVQ